MISEIVGGVFAALCSAGLLLNVVVLVAIVKGALLSNQGSPIYIMSFQMMLVDVVQLLLHSAYLVPSVFAQSWLFPGGISDWRVESLSSAFMFCWYHTTLSQIFVAVNRLVAIVFWSSFFTRLRVFLFSLALYIVSGALASFSQYLSPCCKFTFNWVYFSYSYRFDNHTENFSDRIVDLPLNSSSSAISFVSYSAIILFMHRKSASFGAGRVVSSRKSQKEYAYAMQFLAIAVFYFFAWISFRVFPPLIGNSDKIFLFGSTTICVCINCSVNAAVYLINNSEIKRVLFGRRHPREVTVSNTNVSHVHPSK